VGGVLRFEGGGGRDNPVIWPEKKGGGARIRERGQEKSHKGGGKARGETMPLKGREGSVESGVNRVTNRG